MERRDTWAMPCPDRTPIVGQKWHDTVALPLKQRGHRRHLRWPRMEGTFVSYHASEKNYLYQAECLSLPGIKAMKEALYDKLPSLQLSSTQF